MLRGITAAVVACCTALSSVASAQVEMQGRARSGVLIRQTTDSAAQVDSRGMSVLVPAPGVIEADATLLGLRRLAVNDLSIDILTDLPLGPIHVGLARRALLHVSGPWASGPVDLDIYLPTYDAHYPIQAQVLVELGHTPIIQLPFQFFPGQRELDPVYSVNLVAMFEQGGVLCQDIDELIRQLDDDDIEVRDRATQALIALGERALKKVRDALAGGGLSAEQRARLEYILPRLVGVGERNPPAWEGPIDAGQWDFDFTVCATADGICDIHFMVGYAPGSGKEPSAGYDPAGADVELSGFPEGWSSRYDDAKGEIIVECGWQQNALEKGTVYGMKITTPTMAKKDPKPVGWHYTDKDGKKMGLPGTKGTLERGPRF